MEFASLEDLERIVAVMTGEDGSPDVTEHDSSTTSNGS